MKANELALSRFLDGKHQFKVPVYQRTYSWTNTQCLQLWEDIKRAAKDGRVKHHFIGSIVTIQNFSNTSEIAIKSIIDGQQRVTTILLLIIALARKAKENSSSRSDELVENFLINKYVTGDLRYKLCLTQHDQATFIELIEGTANPEEASTNVMASFRFFEEKVAGEDFEEILAGIRKLMVVDIVLEEGRDNAQLIFESLNSTGLGLTQSDLIRNYLLMGLPSKQQRKIYTEYWLKMEKLLGSSGDPKLFDRFMRDYLTVQTSNSPYKDSIYSSFKKYYIEDEYGVDNIDTVVENLYRDSRYFSKIDRSDTGYNDLDTALKQLHQLKITSVVPFLLSVYNDFEAHNLISKDDFIEILDLLQSYIFRRFVCEIPPNSLTKVFPILHAKIDKSRYIDSLKEAFRSLTVKQRFPDNSEFVEKLGVRSFQHKYKAFLLSQIENFNRKEFVSVDSYTVEHIMPQHLTKGWKQDLGENWAGVHAALLHTIGNLTLTGYNSELSNKTFLEKKALDGGFNNSPLNLNKSLQNISVWNEISIKERSRELAKIAVKIFPSVELLEA